MNIFFLKTFILGLFLTVCFVTTNVIGQTVKCYVPKSKKILKSYDEAMENYKYRKFVEANKILNEIIEKEPDFPDPYFVIGLMYYKEPHQNLPLAAAYFKKSIIACPTYDLYAYYYVGEFFYNSKMYDSAIVYLESFLEDPDKIKNDNDYNKADKMLESSKILDKIYKNPVPFKPQLVSGISTKLDEYLPIITPDNELALFTRKTEVENSSKSSWNNSDAKFKEKFFFSYRDSLGKFDEGEPMPAPFNLNSNEGGATLTIDNKHLYYTVCQNIKNKTVYFNCDICHSEFKDDEWTSIKSVSDKINKPDSWESQPTISADGKTLYFVSDRPGGFGGYDLYKSTLSDNGTWSEATNLGKTINTSGNEKSPFIHTDSQTLYFSSDGLIGLGGYDIFYSKLREDSTWSKPKNIGFPINSSSDDFGFFVSTDGKTAYFSSNKYKGAGGWDLFSFDLYEEARPERVLFIKGNVKDEFDGAIVSAHMELINATTKKVTEIPLDSISGKYVAAVLFRDNYIMTINKDGYAYQSLFLSKEDTLLEAPAVLDIDVKSIEIGKTYQLNDIYFATNSDSLTEDSKTVINSFADFLNENPKIAVAIHGHTDDIGNEAANLTLSNYRSKAVYNYLIDLGIDKSRLSYKGFGETKPIASNQTPEGRSKNRRTEFVIVKK